MAKSLNKVILIGNLGRDPELKYAESGIAYCRFSLATTDSYKNNEGKEIDRTEWHNITVWRQLAEICSKYLKKGSKIYMEGRIRSYVDPKDNTKKYYGVEMTDLIMLDRKEQAQNNDTGQGKDIVHASGLNEDDLPF